MYGPFAKGQSIANRSIISVVIGVGVPPIGLRTH
jgi:hypothetical protein